MMLMLLLYSLAAGYAGRILGAHEPVLIVLAEIGDALLVTVTIGLEAFGMLVGVVQVVGGNDGDDGVLFVVFKWLVGICGHV